MNTKELIPYVLLCIIFTSCFQNKKEAKVNFSDKKHFKYIAVDDHYKMAYLDLGNPENETVLLLHGEPNSSFVYRNIAPLLVAQNYRVIIPDLVGFGFSDKPKNKEIVTYTNHTKWMNNFIKNLNLSKINLFAHDWGGMISLRIVAEKPALFNKVAVSYSYLFEGNENIPTSFLGFVNYAKNDPSFLPGNIMDWGSNTKLKDSIKTIYNKPFKDSTDFISPRKFPSLIPLKEENKEAVVNKLLNKKLNNFTKPFITIWGNHKDLMWIGKDSILQENILGAKNKTHYTLDANHFIQEDKPKELAKILIDFFNSND